MKIYECDMCGKQFPDRGCINEITAHVNKFCKDTALEYGLKRLRMTIKDLPKLLKIAHRVCDEEWKKLGPEKRKRICDNLMKRAEARIKANERDAKRGQS